jgi:hypothetical protein
MRKGREGRAVFYSKGVPYSSPGLRARYPGYALIDNPTPTGCKAPQKPFLLHRPAGRYATPLV